MHRRYVAASAALGISLLVTACSSGATSSGATSSGATSSGATSSGATSGNITVLTNRTDIVDTVFAAKYVPEFQKQSPNCQVKFEALKNYDTDVMTRMNTKDYGDVLLIPTNGGPTPDQLPTFFESLGTVADLGQKYNWVTSSEYNGNVYGLAQTGNGNGVVYNKKVWDAAGITTLPKSPDEFLADLKTINDKNASTPGWQGALYTNYKDGWPTTQWQGNAGEITDNPNFNIGLIRDPAPWSAGKDEYVIGKLMYDVVKQGLTEKDPATTDWETSKGLLGSGKIASMFLGSWAVTQMQEAAVKGGASAEDIHYMPFPAQANGKFVSNTGPDYRMGININSQAKDCARAWITWFVGSSGYSYDQGGLSVVKGGKNAPQYADLDAAGTKYIEQATESGSDVGLLKKIQDESELGLADAKWPQRIIDAARGATNETLDQIFTDLNTKWAAAQAKLGIK